MVSEYGKTLVRLHREAEEKQMHSTTKYRNVETGIVKTAYELIAGFSTVRIAESLYKKNFVKVEQNRRGETVTNVVGSVIVTFIGQGIWMIHDADPIIETNHILLAEEYRLAKIKSLMTEDEWAYFERRDKM